MSDKSWKERLPECMTQRGYSGYVMIRGWVWAVISVICLLLGIATMVAAAAFFDRRSCEQTGVRMGVESQWDFHAGCFIEVNDSMVPVDRVTWNEHGEIVVSEGRP